MRSNKSVMGKRRFWGIVFVLAVLLPGTVQALELVGEYRYAVRPLEGLETAKQTAVANAVRFAIVSSNVFREATASVFDHPLLEHLVDKIIAQGIDDIHVITQQVEGNTVHTSIRAVLNETTLNTLIAQELWNNIENDPAKGKTNRQNRALRILNISENSSGLVAVAFQALQRLDWMTTGYDGGLQDQGDLLITFYDAQDRPLQTDRFPARRAGPDDRDVLVPGQIGIHYFPKPLNASSYEVWVSH